MASSVPAHQQYWGKAMPRAGVGASYHPLVCHLLDVAAVADALLGARPVMRRRLASLLQLDEAEAVGLVVSMVALHDLGKYTPHFQAKSPEHWPASLGILMSKALRSGRHTDDGYLLWADELDAQVVALLWPGGRGVLDAIAQSVFGHHGRPVGRTRASEPARRVFGADGLNAARACAMEVLALIGAKPIDREDLASERAKTATWLVAGLTSLADWIGSNDAWFAYHDLAHEGGIEAYWKHARLHARTAIAGAGLVAPTPAVAGAPETLIAQPSLTPLQRWAADVELPDDPFLIIVEDVTGSGKTEAAQILVQRMLATGRASGSFWAMPTQATANAMYLRQREQMRLLFAPDGARPSLVLAHGQQHLHESFNATLMDFALIGSATADAGDEAPSEVVCSQYLADDRRRALMADIGAGTIDQALLGVLPSRFNTIRLLALSEKVVVVDEAHAYDAYMGIELEQLLRFQSALGGSVVVLSATLPTKTRQGLVQAWRDARAPGGRAYAISPLERQEYPLATLVGDRRREVIETPLATTSWSSREVPVRLVSRVDEAIEHVVAVHDRGAAVAWIRNTVDDCLAAASLLRGCGIEAMVFHARFAQGDRQDREKEIQRIFGRDRGDERRGRVVVATQVIEQSLDLDFDAMVSDIAPVDLLIQRAGRLWRHPCPAGSRPDGVARELVVLAPEWLEEPPADWLSGIFAGSAAVYGEVGVLWRTVRVLNQTRCIRSPDGIRELIEAVYAVTDTPDALLERAEKARTKQKVAQSAANYATLNVSEGYHGSAQSWTSDLRAPTRLSDRQTTIRLARVRDDGGLEPWVSCEGPAWRAWALSEVRVSARRIPPDSATSSEFAGAVNAIRSEWSEWERDVVLLPLEYGDDGVWQGLLRFRGDQKRLEYSVRGGLDIGGRPNGDQPERGGTHD